MTEIIQGQSIVKDMFGEITKINDFEVHPYANIVTLDPDIHTLVDSIRRTGLLHPLLMYKGKIIDGRRRALACGSLGIEPQINDIGIDTEIGDKELYEIVLAENDRRSLSATQKAIIAARETLKGNHKNTPYTDAVEYSAKIWDVSRTTLGDAKWLIKKYPDYATQLFDGSVVSLGGKKYRGVSGLKKALRLSNTKADIDRDVFVAKFHSRINDVIALSLTEGLTLEDMFEACKSSKTFKNMVSSQNKYDDETLKTMNRLINND